MRQIKMNKREIFIINFIEKGNSYLFIFD